MIFTRKLLKGFLLVITFIITVGVILYIGSLAYVLSFSWKTNVPAHADAVLVLGAKVNLNDTPSEALYNRTMQAIQLYKQGKVKYFITTGGVGLGYTPEARIAAIIAEQNGVPADRIISEKESHNTFQNVQDVETQAKDAGIKSVIVVSDQYHIARGALVAHHFGFNPVYWDYPSLSYYNKGEIVRNYAREAAAMLVYVPKVIFSK